MNYKRQEDKGAWKKDLRLYVHVPFCVRKCSYCDFLSGPSDDKTIDSYFKALYREIRSYKGRAKDYLVSSIFIGGGTPSLVKADYISRTLYEIGEAFELSKNPMPEISIEVNPGTLSIRASSGADKLTEYKRAGINRLSFGLQSTHDSELNLLGRIHSYSEFLENFKQARETGFNNINIDLMSGLPEQTGEAWEETLHRIAKLSPEHISAYSLIIEEGTPFYNIYGPQGREKDKLPSEETDRLLYTMTKEILLAYGYRRYEISNYAKEGFECWHNLAYWEGISYLGLGLGSASLINNRRFNNTDSLRDYIDIAQNSDRNAGHDKDKGNDIDRDIGNAIDKEKDKETDSLLYDFYGIRENTINLSKNDMMEEFMFLGLRKSEGVSKSDFSKRFGVSMDDVYGGQLNKLLREDLITTEEDRVRLSDYGIDISNRVLAEFLFD